METNLRPSHSALRCYSIVAQRLHDEWGLLRSLYFLFVPRSWQDEKTSFFISLPSLKLTYHLSYFYLMKTLFIEDTNPYRMTNYALNVSIVRFCEFKASLVWHKGLDDIRRFVCQSKYFVSSIHRKKTCYTVIPTVMLVWTWAELSKIRRRVMLGLIRNVSFSCSRVSGFRQANMNISKLLTKEYISWKTKQFEFYF